MRPCRWLSLSLALLLPLFGCSREEPPPPVQLLDDGLVSTLTTEISGERAKSYVTDLCRYHRIQGGCKGTDYEKAVECVMTFLADAGVRNVRLHTYPSDGIRSYGTWLSRPGFRAKEAQLCLLEPQRSKWCDYAVTAVSLMPYSNGHGVYEGDVVYVGKGTSDSDYLNKDLAGKIVFCDKGDAAAVMREAVLKRGALGILMGFSGNRRRGKFPDLVELNTLRLTGEETRTSTWGFSLSVRQTQTLRDFLESGRRVKMRAVVEAETFAGHVPTISATIPGERYPEQEVVFMAQLDHYRPGANDNASGSAGLMEIAAVLTNMISKGKIAGPLRTIRFLWLPEWNGTAAHVAGNLDVTRKCIAGINLDMIGEDLKRCDTELFITSAPLSRPSFLNAIMAYCARLVGERGVFDAKGTRDSFDYEIIDYFCESDHLLFNDEILGVPTIMLSHFADIFGTHPWMLRTRLILPR